MLHIHQPADAWNLIRELGEPPLMITEMVNASAFSRNRFQPLDVVLENLGIAYQTKTFQFTDLPFTVVADGTTVKHIPAKDHVMWLEVTRP
jgi:hypothetical protein